MEKDLLPLMVHENYPQNIIKTKTKQEELHHLAFASSSMSDYDVMPYEYNSTAILTATTVCHPKSKINFTGYLGKLSSKTKRTNILTSIESKVRSPVGHFRLDYMSYMLMILYNQINSPKAFVDKCVSYGFTKEDIQDNLSVILIAEDIYTRCDYSNVDKKIKASLTKMFSKQITESSAEPAAEKIVSKTAAAAKKRTKAIPSTATATATSTPKPTAEKKSVSRKKSVLPQQTVTESVKEEPKDIIIENPSPPPSIAEPKPTGTIFRRRASKKESPLPEK
jgi:hypothetical protein